MCIHLISYGDVNIQLIQDIIPYFSPVEICLPWGKELPGIADVKSVTALYPAEDFKPGISFERTLNDCINWLEEQGEKSRIELVKAGAGKGLSEESLRQIRHLIVSRETDSSNLKNAANRWHLIIHLAGRIEESRAEADRMLYELGKRPSPLAENLDQSGEAGHPPGAFAEITNDFALEDTYVTHFLDAWSGLFGHALKGSRLLMTLNRRIFGRIFEKWNTLCCDEKMQEDAILRLRVPLISCLDAGEQETFKNNTELWEKWLQLKGLISDPDLDPAEKKTSLFKTIREFESAFPENLMRNHVLFSVLFFDSPSDRETPLKEDLIKLLSSKVLILAEKVVM